MPDILSQEEVDALLDAAQSGDIELEQAEALISKKDIMLYDFRRPDRIPKDQLRTLEKIGENFSRNFSNTLSNYLRSVIEVSNVSTEQLTYSEYILSLSDPTCISIFSTEPLMGQAILEINPNLVFAFVDKLFGGKGEVAQTERDMTTIELGVMKNLIIRALSDLKKAWNHIMDFYPSLEGIETNPQFVQIVWPGETIVLNTFEIKMQRSSGLMSLCFPFSVLEPVLAQMSTSSWITQTQKPSFGEDILKLKKRILRSTMTLTAKLGNASLSFKEVLNLKEGDVIRLNQTIDDKLVVYTGDFPNFWARPGVAKNRKAVQVVGRIKKGEILG